MSFVRTVLGDVDPAELGVTYAHEHVAIAGSRTVELFPDFRLDDVDRAVAELGPAQALGLRTVVDAMPADCGRAVLLLAELSRRSGVHVVASTGVHHARYYPEGHWSTRLGVDELAALFEVDIEEGIDALDYGSPVVRRTPHPAGVIKVSGSDGGPSDRDKPIFEAAAATHAATGCPILTHCEAGTGALEQMALLIDHGVDPGHVALSHVDRVVDRGYHREILATGACVEYDQGFRWREAPNGTLQLLEWVVEDGGADQVVLGMDAARQGYWSVYGGSPGMSFLLGAFADAMRERGIDQALQHRFFVDNPARLYAFADRG